MPPSGLCPLIFGLRPDQGHSPDKFLVALPAGRSPALHRAAKPERKAPNSFRTRCLAFQDGFAQKVGYHAWIQSVQGAIATWSVISMRYFQTICHLHR